MNFDSVFSHTNFRLFYIQNKEYLISGFIIVFSVIVFLLFIPSQVQTVFQLRSDTTKINDKIKVLSSNLEYLSKEDESKLTGNLLIATRALPDIKDFEDIISGISYASSKGGVRVSDYSLEIGDISPDSIKKELTKLSLNITIDGGVSGAQRFIKELSHTFPVMEVASLQTTDTSSHVLVDFFYKPFPLVKLDTSKPISSLSTKETVLLNTLSTFGNAPSVN